MTFKQRSVRKYISKAKNVRAQCTALGHPKDLKDE